MKKFLSVFLVLVLALSTVFALSGCSKNEKASFDVVMITDGASVKDNAYNSYTWDGVKSFSKDNEKSCRYYQPKLDDNGELTAETVEQYVKLSVDNGAEFIVVQGKAYSDIIPVLAPKYADTKFLILGATLYEPISNVMTVSFDSLQAGFLAGYSSVALGKTKLGYLGSVSDAESSLYGTGFVQGAAYGADEAAVPTVLDYAEYDSAKLAYDYSFTVKPIYRRVSECKDETFKVNVINGLGSGVYADGENVAIIANPAPEGKVFDHWEKTSNTDGKSDKKVNISSAKKEVMNLLVGDCDCTIEAVYRDAATQPIKVQKLVFEHPELSSVPEPIEVITYYAEENTSYEVKAPAADNGMVFSHWQCDEGIIEDINNPTAKVNVTDKAIEIQACYLPSDEPTYNVTVENGTGSGSYRVYDKIDIVADAPKDGYMFYKWENIDNQGQSTGIKIDNEYNYNTSFEMIDRCASLVKMFYNLGTEVVFGGGNSHSDSIFTATWDYTYPVYGFGWGIDQGSMGNCIASVVTDYNKAAYNALTDYCGGADYIGNCENGCLYVTGMNTEPTHKDDDGNDVKNDDYNEGYAKVYKALSDGTITPKQISANNDVRDVLNSKCLTLNYYVNE